MSRSTRTAFAFVSVALLGSLLGCSPLRVSFDIGFAPEPGLQEKEVLRDDDASAGADKIALIPVTGMIANARRPGLLGAGVNPVDQLVRRLEKAQRDDDVRAVVLRVNSPGGTVTGSDIMHREVRRFIEITDKPVIASLGEVAASGGYYVALAADRIIGERAGVTGAIGVLVQTVNISEGLARLGVDARAITSGPNKDLANPLEEPRETHYEIIQQMVDKYYGQFRGIVLQRRPELQSEAIERATDGRVFTGAKAAELGLIDETGGVRDAFAEAKQRANIEKARMISYLGPEQEPGSPYGVRASTDAATTNPAAATQINLFQVNLPTDPASLLGRVGFYYLWSPPTP